MSYIKSITAFLAASAVLASCSHDKKNDTTAVTEELPRVDVAVVHQRNVPQLKTYTANVVAENLNNIAPAAPNRIKTINVEVGDHVRRGQTLVTMDKANIDQLKINLDQTEREYNRAVTLLEIGGGTQQTVDQLKAQLDAARSQYANVLENTELVSPITGVVTARNYDPGDMTGNLPVLTVGQLTPRVKVIINVSENDMTLLHNGQNVDVTFDALPGETFRGRIARIYPAVDTTTRTFQAEILVDNASERLKPGMFARVDIILGEKDNIVVPDRAIVKQTGSGNKYVYVLHGNTVTYNRVQTGQRLDDGYELLSGVADGDTVVISGQARLADGINVELIKR